MKAKLVKESLNESIASDNVQVGEYTLSIRNAYHVLADNDVISHVGGIGQRSKSDNELISSLVYDNIDALESIVIDKMSGSYAENFTRAYKVGPDYINPAPSNWKPDAEQQEIDRQMQTSRGRAQLRSDHDIREPRRRR